MQPPGPLDKSQLQSNTLVVLLHGAFRSPRFSANRLSDVRKVVQRALDSPDILAPQLPTHAFAFADPVDLAWRVIDLIDKRVDQHRQKGTPIQHIVLIGYSFGGLLARMVYVLACGETQTERWIVQDPNGNFRPLFAPDRPQFVESREWAGRVRRLVLLAGMNRGWTIDFRVAGLFRTGVFRVSEKLVISLERLINLGRWLLRKPRRTAFGLTFRRGGSFISALRWQWLRMRQNTLYDEDRTRLGTAPVIQLLGTKDDLVGPEDNIDLVTGQDFIYLEMPDCGHNTVVEMDLPSVEEVPAEDRNSRSFYRQLPPRRGRGELLKRALESLEADDFTAGIQDLSLHPKSDDWIDADNSQNQATPLQRDKTGEKQSANAAATSSKGTVATRPVKVTDIAFVIHGIRDLGYWTQKVAWRISEYGAADKRNFVWITRSYGYFPMWPFLFPARRRQHVEWLVDQILEVKSRYPDALMHYCGHSNGTYLLARALEDHSFLKFQHVVFAGSVVRDTYPWKEVIDRGQVSGVLNYVATADLVVGWFPKLFQSLPLVRRLNDIGGGGFDGFADLSLAGTEESFTKERSAFQVAYVSGGHSAAIGEHSWGDIAAAIVQGKVRRPAATLYREKRVSYWARFIATSSEHPFDVWVFLVALLCGILCLTLWINPLHFIRDFAAWISGLKNWHWRAWARLLALWLEWRGLRFILLRL